MGGALRCCNSVEGTQRRQHLTLAGLGKFYRSGTCPKKVLQEETLRMSGCFGNYELLCVVRSFCVWGSDGDGSGP